MAISCIRMKTAVILGAGDFPRKAFPRYLLGSASHIVCCDGAFARYLSHMHSVFGGERLPDAVVGDMDSIPPRLFNGYRGLMHKVDEQEENDQTKALRYVIGHFPDVDAIHILGATGKREDHTIGNLSLLMEYARSMGLDGLGAPGRPSVDVVSDTCTAFAVTDTVTLEVGEGRKISIFSPDNSLKITSKGLHWKTDDVVFDNWWKATLNRADEDTVTLEFSHPSVALIILD